jgi:ABC-type transport system involved in multi-copper enzyme maturation permease subunit
MYYQLGLGPLLNFLNLNSLPLTQDIPAILERLLTLIAVILLGMVLITIGVGYGVLTGWRNRERIAWPLKLLIAFVLGIVTFFFAGLISTLVKIPLVPLIIAGVLLWILLRFISSRIGSAVKYTTLEQAIQAVKSFHTRMTGSPTIEIDEAEFQPNESTWLIRVSDMRYWVDASSGGVVRWRRIS